MHTSGSKDSLGLAVGLYVGLGVGCGATGGQTNNWVREEERTHPKQTRRRPIFTYLVRVQGLLPCPFLFLRMRPFLSLPWDGASWLPYPCPWQIRLPYLYPWQIHLPCPWQIRLLCPCSYHPRGSFRNLKGGNKDLFRPTEQALETRICTILQLTVEINIINRGTVDEISTFWGLVLNANAWRPRNCPMQSVYSPAIAVKVCAFGVGSTLLRIIGSFTCFFKQKTRSKQAFPPKNKQSKQANMHIKTHL